MSRRHDKARLEGNKLSKRLARETTRALSDYNMIESGDKVMVCLSGGKDSYALLDILLQLKKRAPFPFEVIAVNLDQKQPGFPADILPRYLTELGVPFHIETQDTYSIVTRVLEEGKTMCSLCSGCGASCTAWPASWARPRSRWATIATTSWAPSS